MYDMSESDVLHKVYTHSYVASVAVDAFMSCNLYCSFVFFLWICLAPTCNTVQSLVINNVLS